MILEIGAVEGAAISPVGNIPGSGEGSIPVVRRRIGVIRARRTSGFELDGIGNNIAVGIAGEHHRVISHTKGVVPQIIPLTFLELLVYVYRLRAALVVNGIRGIDCPIGSVGPPGVDAIVSGCWHRNGPGGGVCHTAAGRQEIGVIAIAAGIDISLPGAGIGGIPVIGDGIRIGGWRCGGRILELDAIGNYQPIGVVGDDHSVIAGIVTVGAQQIPLAAKYLLAHPNRLRAALVVNGIGHVLRPIVRLGPPGVDVIGTRLRHGDGPGSRISSALFVVVLEVSPVFV